MPNNAIPVKSFTLKAPGRLEKLQTDVLVFSPIKSNTLPIPKMWRGLWDTGASFSCINQRIVDDLKLSLIGKKQISTANGAREVNTYVVNIGLPNNVIVQNVIVACADLGSNIDLLIGMDIISLGDFAITNVNGKTTFSFRLPSISIIDFNCVENPYTQFFSKK